MTWEEVRLFDVPPAVAGAVSGEDERLSPTRRLTARNNALLARGIHPATRLPLLHGPKTGGAVQDGPTCGSCSHHVVRGERSRGYHKCGLMAFTRGAGSDIRTSWPACDRWAAEQ